MNHSFNTEIAKKYGVNEAIIIENLFFWISKNKANNKNFYDKAYWTYNSAKAFQELFPYWTTRQITKILNNLKEKGVIKTGNYNKIAYDRTLWYSFTDEFIKEMEWNLSKNANNEKENSIYTKSEIEIQEKENRNTKNVTPIPDVNTDINTDINQINITKPKVSVNKQDITKKQASYSFESMKLAELLLTKHKELDDRFTITNSALEKWACDIDKLMRIDKRDEAEIVQIITWAKNHDFWQSIILSGSSLRKHYSKLVLQKNGKKNELPEGLQGKIPLDLGGSHDL